MGPSGAPAFVAFFVDRPIFAAVVAILIVLAGAVSIPLLPVAQFPPIAPPTVQVTAQFTGASADVIERTVTLPIEEQVNGVEGMLYMSSNSSNDGRMTLTVTFELGRDPDIATVNVNNRVAVAEPRLPEDVRRFGVTVRKQSPDLTMVVNVFSPDGSRDPLFLSNYNLINVTDALKRVPGVGEVNILGERRYAMRIWLDPDRLAKLELTAADVLAAVREQNLQVAAGLVGAAPAPDGQQFEFTLATKGRLSTVEEFQAIVVRAEADGSVLRLGDVARIELGAQSYSGFTKLSGRPSTTIGIFQLPTANALDVANGVEATMQRLSERFPPGVAWTVVYDPTEFVAESIREVLRTLLEAAVLVFAVVFLFLQDWRATLVPAVTIPVSLIGTFAFMGALGLTTNTITLFGLVLAIGLVVDDAIVVVENVSRLIAQGRPRRQAVLESMGEVTRAIVAATLVLAAVFVPVAFLPGTTGRIYQQFGLAVTCAFLISLLNALTLSPALCALLLRPEPEHKARFFRGFDRAFGALQRAYEGAVRALLPRRAAVLAGFAVLALLTAVAFRAVPTGFMPDEDQGYFVTSVQLPDGASLERTERVSDRVERILLATPGVEDTVVIGGFDLLSGTNPTNTATIFASLAPWAERELSVDAILARVRPEYGALAEAASLRAQSAAAARCVQHGRLRAAGPGSQRRRPARAGRRNGAADRRGQRGARARGPVHHLPRGRSAVLRRARPREGKGARRDRERRVRDPADLSRRCLRQRLRPLWARLPRIRPGGSRGAREARRRQAALHPLEQRRDDPAHHPADTAPRGRPARRPTLQRVSRRPHQRRGCARLQLGRGAREDGGAGARDPARRDVLRVDRSGLPGDRRGERRRPGSWRSRSSSYSCSWLRSTRAGACRW